MGGFMGSRLLRGCGEEEKKRRGEKDNAEAQRSEREEAAQTMQQEWAEELDALQAAAAYHFLQMENEQVRVLETRIPAGHTVPVHTHRWPCVFYVLSWSDFVRRDAKGNVLLDTRGEAGLDAGRVDLVGAPGAAFRGERGEQRNSAARGGAEDGRGGSE